MKTIRVFILSPGNVGEERAIASRVLDQIRPLYATRLTLEPIFWEHEPIRATESFQDGIPSPASCDILICILWSRLGTRLPDKYERLDGTKYDSGTEWEFEVAVQSFRERGSPDMLVYRKTSQPIIDLSLTEEEFIDQRRQKGRVDQLDLLAGAIGESNISVQTARRR